MKLDDVRKILDLCGARTRGVRRSEQDGLKLRGSARPGQAVSLSAPAMAASALVPVPAAAAPAAPAPAADPAHGGRRGHRGRPGGDPVADRRHLLPLGRARRAGVPVEVGDTVRKGCVLCIIEAMKLMNDRE
ncbi:MAG: biotin/lipoyl-containing protein [Vicinamibacterales bacterium]